MQKLLQPVLLCLLLTGCGSASDSNTEREQQLEQYAKRHGVDVDVEINEASNEEKLVISNINGSQTGNNLDMPEGFPQDVAIYPGMRIILSTPIPNGMSLQAQSDDDKATVSAYFAQVMQQQGWTLKPQNAQSELMQSLQFEKGDRVASVMLIANNNLTNIQINAMRLPE